MYILYLCIGGKQILKEKYQEHIQNRNTSFGDSGFDLFVPKSHNRMYIEGDIPITLDHQVQAKLVRVQEEKEIPSAYYLYPRSSITNTVFRMANSVGIIDKGYRGNLKAKLDIHGGIAGQTYHIPEYSRLFQICTPTLEPIDKVILVDSLDETERGDSGFGSTGGTFTRLESL